jgi:hypothetical protein
LADRSALVPRYYLALVGRDVVKLNYPTQGTEAQVVMDRLEGVQGHLVDYVARLEAANDGLQRIRSDTAAISARMMIRTGLSLLDAAVSLMPTSAARIDSVRTAIADVAYVHDLIVGRNYSALVLWVAEETKLWNHAQDIRFLGFAANVAAARSAEEVEQALRAAAAPIGSYRAKRNQAGEWGPRSASIAGYVGGAAGWERGGPSSAAHVGASVPFGLELSWGVPFGAFSFFAPVLDLGTVASMRVGGDDVEAMPEIGFRQVFAPGLFLMIHGSRDLPLTFGVGVQAVNNLRKSETTGTQFGVTRLSFMGGIDATLFNFVW